MMHGMLPDNKKRKVEQVKGQAPAQELLYFYQTYQKKYLVAQTFEKCQSVVKNKPVKGLAHFERAINRFNIEAAGAILAENNYHPFHKNLADSLKYDDLPAIVYWLNQIRISRTSTPLFPACCSTLYGDTTPLYPLHSAARHGNTFCLELILAQGFDINELDDNGLYPLDLAAHQGMTDSIRFLLDHGARENCLNRHSRTPLFYLIPRFSNERKIPVQWIKHLVIMYLTHAQWNPQQPWQETAFTGECDDTPPLSQQEISERLKTILMSFKRVSNLPKDLRYKIIAFLPEYIYCYRLFTLTFNNAQQSPNLVKDTVAHCPFSWFKELCATKLLQSSNKEQDEYVQVILPAICQYRMSRLPELVTLNLGVPTQLVRECIDEIAQKPALLSNAILEALGVKKNEE